MERRPTRRPRRCVLHVIRMKGIAGSERHLLELAGALRARGWRSDAVISGPSPEGLQQYAATLARAGSGRVTVLRTRFDPSVAMIRHIRERLRRERPAILHTHLVHADWHGALAAVDIRGVALVSSKHNHDPFRTGRLYAALERLAAHRCDGTIAISRSLADFIERHAGVCADVVYYGLTPPATPPERVARPMRRIIAVGRLEEQKGHDVLEQAFASVLRTHPDLRLSICGDGPQRRRLARAAVRLRIADRVEFLGWRDDVGTLLSGADLFVHPARWEGFGMVLLEAMGAGLPIIATRVGAIPEVVADGVTGTLVEPDNAEALADAIRRLADDVNGRARLGAAGFERLLSEFSPARMAMDTVRVYEAALRRNSSRWRTRMPGQCEA